MPPCQEGTIRTSPLPRSLPVTDHDEESPGASRAVPCGESSNNKPQDYSPYEPGRGGSGNKVSDAGATVGDETTKSTYCLSASTCNTLRRFAQKWPRLFHLTFKVLIPLLGLIGVSFLCGYFLASAESNLEMSSNDASLAAMFNYTMYISSIAYDRTTVAKPCLADWDPVNDPTFYESELEDYLKDCGEQLVSTSQETLPLMHDVTFDWITCSRDDDGEASWVNQFEHILEEWTADYFRLASIQADNGKTFQQAHDLAVLEASGHGDCRVHTAAGALFWFTVMTTMGYGNSAPLTTVGRALVYTLGFVSILLFGSIIHRAGSICLAIFDDFALRHKAKLLTKGFGAPFFWLAVLCFWLLILAFIFMYDNRSGGTDCSTLAESFWFAYISITTVGLGDFYIRHETFRATDMFVYPFLFLMGFVLMANFLLKLREWIADILPNGPNLDEILQERRNKTLSNTATT